MPFSMHQPTMGPVAAPDPGAGAKPGAATMTQALPAVPSGEQLANLDRDADPNAVNDPATLIEMIGAQVLALRNQQETAITEALALIGKPPKPEPVPLLERILQAAVGLAIGMMTDGLSSALFSGAKHVAPALLGHEGLGGELVDDAAKKVIGAGPDAMGDAMKERGHAPERGETVDLYDLQVKYGGDVRTDVNVHLTRAQEHIAVNRVAWQARPAAELRALLGQLRALVAQQRETYRRAVMMGWMDLRARLATAHATPAGAAPTMMPGGNARDGTTRDAMVWQGEIPGMIEIHFEAGSFVNGTESLRLAHVQINAEDKVVEEIKASGLSLQQLRAPRRVHLGGGPGGGISANPEVWFVVTADGALEVAPGAWNQKTLAAIGANQPRFVNMMAGEVDHALAIKGAHMVYAELAHYTAHNANAKD